MRLLLLLLVCFVAVALGSFSTETCTNTLTGFASDTCTVFAEYDNSAGTLTQCEAGGCACPQDTCNPGSCHNYYVYGHGLEGFCPVTCQTAFVCEGGTENCAPWACDWSGCPAFTGSAVQTLQTGAGSVPNVRVFCTTSVRATYCNAHGDYGTANNPLTNTNPFKTSFTCDCDCGYTGTCSGAMSTTTATCINPYSRATVSMVAVTNPAVNCRDPSNNVVTCWCPSDTCFNEVNPYLGYGSPGVWCVPLANGSMSVGSKYYNTQRNRGWYFCGDGYRLTICNNHGDSTHLEFVTATAATDGSASCVCDCGYTGSFCATAASRTCAATTPCINPATGNSVSMIAPCYPNGYVNVINCINNACWCPSDTCSLVTSSGSPAAPYMQCNAINGVGYIGVQQFTGARQSNTIVFCSQSFRTVVCNGHGDTLLQTGVAWNAFPNNLYSQTQAPCQCDNGWFNTNSNSQCNIFVTCPSPRAGRAPAGAGMCGFTGWGASNTQGYCTQTGQCQCLNGWSGTACDSFCPTNNNAHECSNDGFCDLLNSPFAYLAAGHWGTHQDSFAQDGTYALNTAPLPTIVAQIEQFATAALFQRNQYAAFTPQYSTQLQNACIKGQQVGGAANGIASCFEFMARFFFQGTPGSNFAAFQTSKGYAHTDMTQMVSDMFVNYYGFLTADARWTQSTALPALFASTNVNVTAQGLALFLSYEQFVDFSSAGFSAPYPSFPSVTWRCNCNSNAGSTGPSGPDCTAACPTGWTSGSALPACGGILDGEPHGQCITASNTCDCARNYVGPACTVSLAGKCFDDTTAGADVICSGNTHGTCNVTTVGSTTLASCQCASTWTGQFCQISKCSHNTTECSNHGSCTNSGCVCTAPTSTVQSPPPQIWAGPLCNVNVAAQCGYFVPNLVGGGGQWSLCYNHGSITGNQCLPNATGTYRCVCTGGQGGQFCQNTVCNPACSSHQVCNPQGGTCSCQTMWSGTGCNTNLCGNGVPSADGTKCLCNPYYRVDSNGHCTITQCPLVFSTSTGVRACVYTQDVNCTNPELGSPQSGCCWDACGQGSTSECIVTNGQPTCNCDTTLYNQTGGICYSRCNGQPVSLVNGQAKCDCSAVQPGPNQWVSSTDCSLHTCSNGAHVQPCQCGCACTTPPWTGPSCDQSDCVNGGTPGLNGCNCPFAWGGPTCSTNQCQNGGTPTANGTMCICPRAWTGPMCHTSHCSNGGTPNTQGTACNCPTPYNGTFCTGNTCLHGGTPSGSSCSCPFPYSGTNCASNQCVNGGTPVNNTCSCPFPYTGSTCSANLCRNGGTPSGSTCHCVSGFGGNVCQLVSSCNHGGILQANHTCTCPRAWGGDTCATSQCQHGGTPTTDGQSCTGCEAVWSGTLCQASQCQHGGTPNQAGTACVCPFPYSGMLCASNKCLHGGTPLGSTCQCSVPWKGSTCNTTACEHGGTASSDNTECVCPSTFSGTLCQTHVNGTTPGAPSTGSSTALSTGAIAGIAVGGAAAAAGIAVGIYYGVLAARKGTAVVASETTRLLTPRV